MVYGLHSNKLECVCIPSPNSSHMLFYKSKQRSYHFFLKDEKSPFTNKLVKRKNRKVIYFQYPLK
jgi:hypothetical protein